MPSRTRACRRARALRRLCGSLLLLLVPATAAHAQDEVQDSGSRASRTADADAREADESSEPHLAAPVDGDRGGSSGAAGEDDPEIDVDYHMASCGGIYPQDPRMGVLVDAAVELELSLGRHKLSSTAEYLHDPFSTKTFNFADDDQGQDAATTQSRVVQPMHELDGGLGWRARWLRWMRTDLELEADAWWPADRRDRRWSLRLQPRVRFGRKRGVFSQLRGELFLKKYPNYYEADRRLDSRGVEGQVEGGYDFGELSASGGYELRFTDYLDARYDALTPDGDVTRATESKNYLRSAPFAHLTLEPIDWLRISLRYKLEWHDSQYYDRRMTGRDDSGASVAKLIPSYYDYTRHRLALRARLRPIKAFVLELLGEFWVRDFDFYEARDADNTWTGELRHDENLELGLETGYRLWRFGSKAQRHELHVIAFASHLVRSSNMRRELSFATNFEVTRIFVGLELRGP